MDFATGKKAIDFFWERCSHLNITFFGGEPLLEADLFRQLVKYAEQKADYPGRVSFVVVTNGVLFKQKIVEFCGEHKVSYALSFDGIEPAQDAGRIFPNGRGSFVAVDKNLPAMVRNDPDMHVISVIGPNNMAYLRDSLEYLYDTGVRNMSLSPEYTHPQFAQSLEEMEIYYRQAAEFYLQQKSLGKEFFLSAFDDGSSEHNRGKCRLGQGDFSVSGNGTIYPCCCFVDHDRYPLGDINGGFDTGKADRFYTDLAALYTHIDEQHRDCPEHSFCKNGCGCTNIVTTKQLAHTSDDLCQHGRMEARVRQWVQNMLSQTPERQAPALNSES